MLCPSLCFPAQSLAALLLPAAVRDLSAAANHFKKVSCGLRVLVTLSGTVTVPPSPPALQCRVHEMVAVLLSGGAGRREEVWAGLSAEDAEAVDTLMKKGGKKKRTKRMKIKEEKI